MTTAPGCRVRPVSGRRVGALPEHALDWCGPEAASATVGQIFLRRAGEVFWGSGGYVSAVEDAEGPQWWLRIGFIDDEKWWFLADVAIGDTTTRCWWRWPHSAPDLALLRREGQGP